MSFLSRFSILTKILAAIGLISLVATGIAALAVSSLKSLSEATDQMEEVAALALTGARMNQNVLSINRAEYRLGMDPRLENRTEARKLRDEEVKAFQDRLARVKSKADAETSKIIGVIESDFASYLRDLDGVFKTAESVHDVQMTEQLIRLHNTIAASRAVSEKLRGSIRMLVESLDRRVETVSKEATAEYLRVSKLVIIAACVGILFGLGLGLLIGQYGISKPIRGMVLLLQRLASGEFDVEIAGKDRKDEVGLIGNAVESFRLKLAEKARLEAEEKRAQEARLEAECKRTMHEMANSFESAIGGVIERVSSASTELEAAAHSLAQTAETSQGLAAVVASASEEASANVQSVASAAEEMAGSVSEISRQVQESTRIAADAVKQADKTDARISELSQAASRIGDVVKLITAIAEQTNLLALNATIEAARAGEAGRGFAVVAQEVKALAAQTAKATGEISAQITGMQAATQDSVAAIKEIGGTIDRMSEIAAAIAAAVEEQGAATQEIARNVQKAAQGTSQVAQSVGDVNKGASETGSASSQVLASAQSLSGESSRLKAEVDTFLSTVRAA